jgi:hypothetical protein
LSNGYADQNGPIHPAILYGAEFIYQPWVPFGVGIELRGQFSYLFTVGPEVAYNTLNVLAAAKYWF